METVVGLDNVGRLFSRGTRLTPTELRACKPLRNDQVVAEAEGDGVVLRAKLASQGTGVLGVLAKWAKAPDEKRFELEPVGAFVWERCDGRHTFDTISRHLRERYKMNRLEADAALTEFLSMLSERHLITLAVPQPKVKKS